MTSEIESPRPSQTLLSHHDPVMVPADRDSPFASKDRRDCLPAHRLEASVRRLGNRHDNAVAESLFQLLKRERMLRKPVRPAIYLARSHPVATRAHHGGRGDGASNGSNYRKPNHKSRRRTLDNVGENGIDARAKDWLQASRACIARRGDGDWSDRRHCLVWLVILASNRHCRYGAAQRWLTPASNRLMLTSRRREAACIRQVPIAPRNARAGTRQHG